MAHYKKIIDLINQEQPLIADDIPSSKLKQIMSNALYNRHFELLNDYAVASEQDMLINYKISLRYLHKTVQDCILKIRTYIVDNHLDQYGEPNQSYSLQKLIDKLDVDLPKINDDNYIKASSMLQYIISNAVDKRAGKIVKLHFFKNIDMKELSIRYTVSRERIRQLIERSLNKICKYMLDHHINNYNTILIGADVYKQMLEQINKDKIVIEDLQLRRRWARFDTLDQPLMYNGNNLIFSVRTTNCLCRAGISNIRSILATRPGRLQEIRGLGRRSFDEIVNILGDKYNILYSKTADQFFLVPSDEDD